VTFARLRAARLGDDDRRAPDIQEPGFDGVTTVKAGAPLAVAVLGVFAFAAGTSVQHEQEGSELRELPAE